MKNFGLSPGRYSDSANCKIVINTIPLLGPLTGIGNYTFNLSKTFLSIGQGYDYTFSYGNYCTKDIRTFEDSVLLRGLSKVKENLKRTPLFGAYGRMFKDIMPTLNKGKYDLYFEPNFIPTNIKAEKIVTAVCDLSFKKFPHCHPRDRIEYFNKHFEEGLKRSDRVIVLSSKIKNELVDISGIKKDAINVIPAGVDREMFRFYPKEDVEKVCEKYHLPEKFILYVGAIEPRKNLKGLLNAYFRLDVRKEFKLVLVGALGWENKDELQLFTNYEEDIIFLGHIPSIDIAHLMNKASCLVYPSIYEGFGLPPLEAMACGCPVVVSEVSSIPEACGDAAYYVDPYKPDSIAEGLNKVLTDETLRQVLIKNGLERIKSFSWEESARKHLEVFNDVLNP